MTLIDPIYFLIGTITGAITIYFVLRKHRSRNIGDKILEHNKKVMESHHEDYLCFDSN